MKFKESFVRFLESHDFDIRNVAQKDDPKKTRQEAVKEGVFVTLIVTPTEDGYLATAREKGSSLEASAEAAILMDAVVDCYTEFEDMASSQSSSAADELSDMTEDLEDDTGDYEEEDDENYDGYDEEDDGYDEEDEDI